MLALNGIIPQLRIVTSPSANHKELRDVTVCQSRGFKPLVAKNVIILQLRPEFLKIRNAIQPLLADNVIPTCRKRYHSATKQIGHSRHETERPPTLLPLQSRWKKRVSRRGGGQPARSVTSFAVVWVTCAFGHKDRVLHASCLATTDHDVIN